MTVHTDLTIEYVGGPRDGDRSVLLRSAPKLPVHYPPEIRVFNYDLDEATEELVGRYVRDHMAEDNAAMRYLWVNTRRGNGTTQNST